MIHQRTILRGLVIVVIALALLLEDTQSLILIPSLDPSTCNTASEYYDTSVLSCNRCVGPSGGAATANSLLIPDTQDLDVFGLPGSCSCRKSSYRENEDDSTCASTWPAPCNLEICTKCPPGLVPTRDARMCLPCGNSTMGFDTTSSDCKCEGNAILVEKNESGGFLPSKECITCMNGTRADPDTNECLPCGSPAMMLDTDTLTGAQNCICKSGYQLVASAILGVTKCVAQSRIAILNAKVNLNLASTIKYSDFEDDVNAVVSFSSDLVQDLFLLVATECYFYQNAKQTQYCQALGNLCVLQHLSPVAPPCALFDLIQKSGRSTSANDVNGWYYTLPFLYYGSNADSVLKSTQIGMMMSFDEEANLGTQDHLEFVLASYTVNGTLTGFKRLSNQLLYCLDASVSASATIPLWMRFGVSTSSHITCDISAFDTSEPTLHELFLVDRSKAEGASGRYVPIPVQNLNYADARGLYINQNSLGSDAQDDFLTNRFVLFDATSGIQVGEKKTRVYRYANTIKLTIRTRGSEPSAIYPPLLTIGYADTQTALQAASIQFQVVYASDTSRFWAAATTILVIAFITAGVRVLLHIFTWQRRNSRHDEMALTAWHSISHLITSIVSNYARACFFVLFILSMYFLLFFKLQSTVFLLLPDPHAQLQQTWRDEYYPFRVVIAIAFAFQLVTILHRVYEQSNAHLFLIDWEKPRAKVIDVDSSQVHPAPVSIWRTIFVANEWNKLQTVRKTSLRFTLVIMLFLLYGYDLRSLALPIPRTQMAHVTTKATTTATLTTDQDLALNAYLRFAVVASLWLVLCLGVRVWKWLIYERFFSEPYDQIFVDLCTVAKVSCFIVDETYHGFYLHCRSPYPFADGSMVEIVEQLKQETAGLTVGRGLDSSMPDCQLFEMFFTRKWKRKYLTLYNNVHATNANQRRRMEEQEDSKRQHSPTRGAITRSREAMMSWQPRSTTSFIHGWQSPATPTTKTTVEHATELTNFLKTFIENQDDQFRWRIYRMETCLTRFFGIPPEMSATRQSYFLPDADSRFTRVLFLGIENDLMLMNILCFTAFDLWLDNHAISAFATYLLEALLVYLRSRFGGKNVARTSLVDSRFLM